MLYWLTKKVLQSAAQQQCCKQTTHGILHFHSVRLLVCDKTPTKQTCVHTKAQRLQNIQLVDDLLELSVS